MAEQAKNIKVPEPTIRRLPAYCRVLKAFQQQGMEWVSATDIAQELDLKPIQVRKDMSLTGAEGRPKRGFLLNELLEILLQFLHWDENQRAVLVGAGALGTALLGYSGFAMNRLEIVSVFDSNPEVVGSSIYNRTIEAVSDMEDSLTKNPLPVGIITVPAAAAQEVADRLVALGVRAIWNFAPIKLKLPEGIIVEQEDLSSGFALLTVKLHS